jgi:tetratricopeptide (TPR) repeat protein
VRLLAVSLITKGPDIVIHAYSDDHPDVAEAACHLGVALQDQGRLDEALEKYEQALYTYRKVCPALCRVCLRSKSF